MKSALAKILDRKILNVAYGLIGIYLFFDTLERLWQEGTFGNETHILFLVMIGPEIGFLKLSSALFLTIGQVLNFYNKKSGIWSSRISFLYALMTLAAIYIIYERWYIWSYTIDFLFFSIIVTFFYLPIIINNSHLERK